LDIRGKGIRLGAKSWLIVVTTRMRSRDQAEDGMTTAELLGNAALGIAALVAIWAVLQALGLDIVNWIRGQLGV
jgi:uncharacterized membrane protein